MFGHLFRRAQATVDNAIGMAISRALVAIPFLVAAAFGVAALSVRLNRHYDPEIANLILAGLFTVVGAITALLVYGRSPAETPVAAETSIAAAASEAPAAAEPLKLSAEDKDLLVAALSTAAPMALPGLLQLIWRNLPLLLAVGVALFTLLRATGAAESEPTTSDGGGNSGEGRDSGVQAARAA